MTTGKLMVLWLVPVLQFVLALVIWKRGVLLRMFPAFFGYTCYAVAATALQLVVINRAGWYFRVYWVDQAIYGILGLLVMREVFQAAWDLRRGLRPFLVWAVALLLAGLATLWGTSHPDGHTPSAKLVATIDAFLAGVHAVQLCLCIVALMMFRKFNQYQIGIVLGFSATALVSLLSYVGYFLYFSRFGSAFQQIVLYAPISAYMASIVIWLIAFLSRPRVTRLDPQTALELMREQEELARALSSELGLKWPGKKGNDSHKHCPAGTSLRVPIT